MLSFIKSKIVLLAALVTASTILLSFKPAGGEGFEIYLNNKLVMQMPLPLYPQCHAG